MNILKKTTENKASVVRALRLLGAAALVFALIIMAVDTAQAQQIPRRLDSLQLIKPIAPPPVPPVERLRQDIIGAVNPRTGTVDVRKLYTSPSRPGPGVSVGSGPAGIFTSPSRPDPGQSVGSQPGGLLTPPSRSGRGASVNSP